MGRFSGTLPHLSVVGQRRVGGYRLQEALLLYMSSTVSVFR